MSTPTPPRDRPSIASPVEQPPALPTEPLSNVEARRAEAEALQRTLETSQEASESRRRGRVEAETRRVSDEVTKQAQERLRQERISQEQSLAPLTGGNDETLDALNDFEVTATSRTLPEPMSIERVLVPLDATPYAERALPYGLALASFARAAVVLAHVQERKPGRARVMISMALEGASTGTPVRGEQDAAAYLDTIREHVRAEASNGPRVETITLSADTAADGLIQIAERADADVVVLATHARQGLERRILGSVGDQLVQRTHVPVLLIPPGLAVPTERPPRFRRVLIPLDGSALAEQALAPVLALARCIAADDARGMDIVLYYVAESQVTRPDGARYVQEMRERLLEAGLPTVVSRTATAMVGSPPGSITSAAIHGVITEPDYPQRFDLVVMATHGRGGFQRWLYGSVAEYVLSHIAVPTLLVHPEQTDM